MAGDLTQALGGFVPALRLERLSDLPVKHGAAGEPEILIERVLHERVGECEAPRPVSILRQQRSRNRTLEQIEQPRLGKLEHIEQQIEVEVTPDHRRCAERRASLGSQPLPRAAR